MDNAANIESTLLSMADPKHARQLLRFFKTGPGEYGEGDIFLGIKNPQIRLVVKDVWKTTTLSETTTLIQSPLHEIRLCGLLIMVEQYLYAQRKKNFAKTDEIFSEYISLHPFINNWDLVDLSAIKIVGNHEASNPMLTIMDEWINPDGHTLWQQRIAMVSTWMLTHNGNPEKCFSRATKLLTSPHNLLHKAAGWMLRETWKNGYSDNLREFLEKNICKIPSVMLSYACEQMSPQERKQWQTLRRTRK